MIMTREDADRRVRFGAAMLDRLQPEWWTRIDVRGLQMMTCKHCVLGQLFGQFETGLAELHLPTPDDQHDEWTETDRAVLLGFVLTDEDSDDGTSRLGQLTKAYAILTEAWLDAIVDRVAVEV